jgi:putative ABC transport system permease protein
VVRLAAPNLALDGARSLDDLVAEATAAPRFNVVALVALGTVCLTLSALGVYGLVSRSVTRRRREIGIRLALGAEPHRLVAKLVAGVLAPAAVGVFAGLAGAAIVGRAVQSLLFGITGTDPIAFAAVPLLMMGIACLASLGPSRRALRLDPARTLKED